MDLERINLALRPRGEWEAIDLGLRLAQRNAGMLYAAWLMSSAPFALVIGVIFIYFGDPLWAYVTFWLIKPLFDRVLLHLFGRLIFDDRPDRRELRRIALRMPFQAAWFRAITWGRLDFSRSFSLPVWQLEGLRGSTRSRRAGVLGLGAGGAAIMLSLGALASVALLYLAVFSVAMSFVVNDVIVFDLWSMTDYVAEIFRTIAEGGNGILWTSFITYYLCEGFIAPFYVGGGFCLYLNRRTHIEAWDVELQFRRAIKRRGMTTAIGAAMLLILVAPNAPFTSAAQAQDDAAAQDEFHAAREEMRTIIDGILQDDDFGRTVKQKVWREKQNEDDKDSAESRETLAERESLFSVIFGSLTEVVLWSLLLIGAVALVVTRDRWLPWFRGEGHARSASRDSTGGLLLDARDMPDDLPGQVRALWEEGRKREAASLLYRGTLTLLNDRYSLKVHDSDTEGDCVRRVRAGTDGEITNFFTRVTRSWQRLAYAHQVPDDSEIDKLCTDFSTTLDVAV